MGDKNNSVIKTEYEKGLDDLDDIMCATDNPLFFGWKDLKPLLKEKSNWDYKWLFMITSGRSVGKSTCIARYLLADYIVHQAKWLYVRRTKEVLWLGEKKFFDKAIEIFNRTNLGFKIPYFTIEAGKYYITIEKDGEDYSPQKYDRHGELVEMTPEEIEEAKKKNLRDRREWCGISLALKAYEKAKGSGYDGNGIIHFVFDEFMAEQTVDYLGTKDTPEVEWDDLLSIYASLDRGIGTPFLNETNVFCLGNNSHSYNPILIGSGFNEYYAQSPNAKKISPKYEEWIYIDVQPNAEFKELQKKSRLYRAMKHSPKLQAYNFSNENKDDKIGDEFLSKNAPKDVIYRAGVVLNGKEYGIYERDRDGLVYIGEFKKGHYTEAVDIGSYSNGNVMALVRKWDRSPALCLVHERFLYKKVIFKDERTAREFMRYLDFIPR